jgi:hypothetical protein
MAANWKEDTLTLCHGDIGFVLVERNKDYPTEKEKIKMDKEKINELVESLVEIGLKEYNDNLRSELIVLYREAGNDIPSEKLEYLSKEKLIENIENISIRINFREENNDEKS